MATWTLRLLAEHSGSRNKTTSIRSVTLGAPPLAPVFRPWWAHMCGCCLYSAHVDMLVGASFTGEGRAELCRRICRYVNIGQWPGEGDGAVPHDRAMTCV
jgi:hypothetical protein